MLLGVELHMSWHKYRYQLAGVIVGTIIFGSSCRSESIKGSDLMFKKTAASASPEPTVFTDGRVEFENVRFRFDRKLVEKIEVNVIPAAKLESEDIKPDRIGARSLEFVLENEKAEERGRITVFKIAEYREAFARFPHYLQQRDNDLLSLIKNNSLESTWGIDEPVHVRWMDAHHDFYAKAQIVNFHGGRGLLMLTQIGQDATSLITNDGLEYFFQGLTDDGVYFVEMSFTVGMQGLPPNFDSVSAGDYGLPDDYYRVENGAKFREYAMKIAEEIDKSRDEVFNPSPSGIRDFIASFEIR